MDVLKTIFFFCFLEGERRLLLFNYKRPASKRFVEKLSPYLQDDADSGLPFQLRVAEAVMAHVCDGLEEKYRRLVPEVTHVLRLDASLSYQGSLEALLPIKNAIRTLDMELNEIRNAVKDLLENDDDLDGLYLAESCQAGGGRGLGEHEEAEIMLENYFKRIEQIMNDVAGLKEEIEITDEFAKMALDRSRNSILKLALLFNTMAVSATVATIIPSLFGMNLTTAVENDPRAFYVAGGGTLGCAAVVLMAAMALARRHNINLFKM